jgi:mycothiol synthase
MTSSSEGSTAILPCPPSARAPALELVFGDFAKEARAEQIQRLLEESASNPAALGGLFAAWQGAELRGAILARLIPGRVAIIWPPRLQGDDTGELALGLLEQAVGWSRQLGAVLAQSLPASAAREDQRRLRAAGFDRIAELVYLMCRIEDRPSAASDEGLEFEPYSAANHQRLKDVVRCTYQGSLDCPEIDGLRDIDDVLEGYRATGVFDPSHWLLVCRDGEDIGCLLLADEPSLGHWELVYLGIVPTWRGQKIGFKAVRHALCRAAEAGRERVVLSVDARNEPAIQMYQRAGFTAWERRPVFIKRLGMA